MRIVPHVWHGNRTLLGSPHPGQCHIPSPARPANDTQLASTIAPRVPILIGSIRLSYPHSWGPRLGSCLPRVSAAASNGRIEQLAINGLFNFADVRSLRADNPGGRNMRFGVTADNVAAQAKAAIQEHAATCGK
jgi:hypothetical protein